MTIDETELRKAIKIIKEEGQLFEVRLIPPSKNYKTPTYNAYFDDVEKMIDSIKNFQDDSYNVYFSLNNVKEGCNSRNQYNKFMAGESTISDNDIEGYDYLFVDIDPDRPKGISSSDEELQKAKNIANNVYYFMDNLGFSKPIRAYSGNGVHLLYKVFMGNNKENANLMKECLITLDTLFSTEECHIDIVNFNPSRICKLYGTVARKGRHTEERPHRIARIVGDYETKVNVTDIGYLKKLAKIGNPEVDEPSKYNNYNPKTFELTEWLNEHGINYRETSCADGEKFILDHCPFDNGHTGKDACLFRRRNGAIGFKCLHNSCADKTWKDVRMLYEPNAYERKQKEYSKDYYSKPNNDRKEAPVIVAKENEPIFLTATQIRNSNEPEPEFIPTGIKEFDKLERGLARGDVSVWTGNSGGGKSSILTEIILNLVDNTVNGEKKPYSCVCYSGEMNKKKVLRWVHLMAAGKSYLAPTDYEDYYNVPYDIQDKIDNWLGENYYLYDNKYGHNFVAILAQLEKILDEKHLDVVILDNLMILDTTDLSNEELTAQKMFILELKKLAPKYNCHVICVCHPKKNYGLIRVADIKGSTDIRALADEIILLHRVNDDFKKGAKEYFSWKDNNPLFEASNLIEIGKSRDGGNADKFIPLYFEKETKRLKNTAYENKIYGWNTTEEAKYGFDAINFNVDESPFEVE